MSGRALHEERNGKWKQAEIKDCRSLSLKRSNVTYRGHECGDETGLGEEI